MTPQFVLLIFSFIINLNFVFYSYFVASLRAAFQFIVIRQDCTGNVGLNGKSCVTKATGFIAITSLAPMRLQFPLNHSSLISRN